MYPALLKSYKGLYPFKLGTTSYIYPDHIIPNVKLLAPYLDEVELILFESESDSLPSTADIKTLALISEQYDLTYNVHLPLDISLGSHDPSTRQYGVEIIKKIFDLTFPLSPSTYTLHLNFEEDSDADERIIAWQEIVCKCMEQLLKATDIKNETISIETLAYPLEWVEHILTAFNLSVCLDIGHLIVNGFDLENVFHTYAQRTSIIHLHGADKQKDHLALDRLSKSTMDRIIRILRRFNGTVSLEVFSYPDLVASLNVLEQFWR